MDNREICADEKPINPETYVFRYHKKAKQPEQRSITRLVNITPETDERIKRYAKKGGHTYSHALHCLLDTKEAAEMEPPVVIDWVEHARKKFQRYYLSHEILGLKQPKKRKKKRNNENRNSDNTRCSP